MIEDLVGKVALVTGASGDIGLAITDRLLTSGCTVFAAYHTNRSTLDQLAARHAAGSRLHICRCDVSDPADIDALLIAVEQRCSRIDVLVNNAGIYKDGLFQTMELADFDTVVRTNLYSVFAVTKAALRLLRAARGSSVINMGSVAGLTGSFGQCNYSAAKSGISGLTRTLASELTAKGVRVNALAPGLIDSSMVKRVSRTVVRQALEAIPAQRLGTTADVANVVAFLASAASGYIVGQTIAVDGGLVMR